MEANQQEKLVVSSAITELEEDFIDRINELEKKIINLRAIKDDFTENLQPNQKENIIEWKG